MPHSVESLGSEVKFRQYQEAKDHVSELYKINHERQTLQFVLSQKKKYEQRQFGQFSIWQVMELLDSVIDQSDPDTELSQTQHALQSAEACRKDGRPRWMILTCLIHDLGKLLTLHGEPQWAVVGDTFPVGCAFSDKIVYSLFFENNPDSKVSAYQTQYGIYQPNCGLDQIHLSYGHDEYLYHVTKPYLPKEALFIIRYHSFYALHTGGAYDWFMNDEDRKMLEWLRIFNQYDLYSKSGSKINVEEVKPFYLELINEFFPETIEF